MGLVRVREVWRNTTTKSTGEQAGQNDRQEQAALQAGVTNSGGAGVTVTTAGCAGVTRAGGMTGGQRRDIGGAPGADLAIQGCSSDNREPGRNRNVTFVKAGKCYRPGCNQGSVGRRHNPVTGSSTPAPTNGSKSGKRK